MIDDTQVPFEGVESYGSDLFREMGQMAKYQIDRRGAKGWAHELLFITFDSDYIGEVGEPDDGMSIPDCDSDSGSEIDNSGDHELEGRGYTASKSFMYDESMCKYCQGLPSFPVGVPSTFRLRRSRCPHFVAVSYCWPKNKDGNPRKIPQTYSYGEMIDDGSIRVPNMVPPDEVIDRAVRFARELGLRQIWIDQVCLPQDNSDEHQIAIQAIDYVYQKTDFCLGLMEDRVGSIEQAMSYNRIFQAWREHGSISQVPLTDFHQLSDFVEILAKDQWNTRAWILQEAFAADDRMWLQLRLPNDDDELPEDPKFTSLAQFPGSLTFTLDDIVEFRRDCNRIIDLLEDRSDAQNAGLIEKLCSSVDSLVMMSPGAKKSQLESYTVAGSYVDYVQLKPRKRCNAALALTYLKDRKNHLPADRLAILANICDYWVRLDTRQLARFPSLGVAYVALSLLNGDFSLLTDENYYTDSKYESAHGFLWCPQFRKMLPSLARYTVLHTAMSTNRQQMHISEKGLRGSAIIWDVNQSLDLSEFRKTWIGLWATIWTGEQKCPDDENPKDFADRIGKLPFTTVGEKYHTIARKIGKTGVVRTLIVILLHHLSSKGYKSVAESIWQSLRMEKAQLVDEEDAEYETLPDTFGEYNVAPTGRNHLLGPQLDLYVDDDGCPYAIWLVSRIMRDGEIWVGHGRISNPSGMRIDKNDSKDSNDDYHQRTMVSNYIMQLANVTDDRSDFRFDRDWDKQFKDRKARAEYSKDEYDLLADEWACDYTVGDEVAVFNVDGPCLVAVPFDADFERIPHPFEREQKICWTVEHAPMPGAQASTDESLSLLAKHLSVGESSTRPQKSTDTQTESPPQVPLTMKESNRYRVLGKTSGYWPVMESDPRSRYLFI